MAKKPYLKFEWFLKVTPIANLSITQKPTKGEKAKDN